MYVCLDMVSNCYKNIENVKIFSFMCTLLYCWIHYLCSYFLFAESNRCLTDDIKNSKQRNLNDASSVCSGTCKSDTLSFIDNYGSVISDSSSPGVQGQSSVDDNTNQKTVSSTTASHQQRSGSSMSCSNSQDIAASEKATVNNLNKRNDSLDMLNMSNTLSVAKLSEVGCSDQMTNVSNSNKSSKLNNCGHNTSASVNHCDGPQACDNKISATTNDGQNHAMSQGVVDNEGRSFKSVHQQQCNQSSNNTSMSGWDAMKPNSWNIPNLSGQNKSSPVVFKNQSISSKINESTFISPQNGSTNVRLHDTDDEVLGATGGRSPSPEQEIQIKKRTPPRLGLLGGGESALASHNTSSSGWGSGSGSSTGWGTTTPSNAVAGNRWTASQINLSHHHVAENPRTTNPVSPSQTEGWFFTLNFVKKCFTV